MKVILFTLEYPPFYGGVANYYGNLVKYWPESNNIVVLNNNEGKLINNKLPLLKWAPAVWYLWKSVKKEKASHILVGHILPLGTAAYLVFKFLKINYSVILHGMEFTYCLKSIRKKWLARKILESAQNVICVNSYTANLVKNFLGEKNINKIKIVNPGVDAHITHNMEHVTCLREKHGLKNKVVLFSIGRLVKRKGFDKVVEAMPEILKKVSNLVYIIAGVGPDEKYLKGLAENRGDRRIIFLGKISDEEKWAWLNICDIFTMPSREIKGDFEGFGIVYLEASLAGKPIVAGKSGGVEDAVLDGETGLLVNPEDTKEIADAIIKLAKDENLRKKLGEAGKKRAEEEFNWKKQIDKIYSIIKIPFLKGDR